MRLEILGAEKAHVVGGDHRQIELTGELDRGRDMRLLAGAPGAHQLEVVAPREGCGPALRQRPRAGAVARRQRLADITRERTGQGDQMLAFRLDPGARQQRLAARLALSIGA